MDLVSIETPEENTMVENIINKYGSDGVWTSGRLCNFHGCDVCVFLHHKLLLILNHIYCRHLIFSPNISMDGSGQDQV